MFGKCGRVEEVCLEPVEGASRLEEEMLGDDAVVPLAYVPFVLEMIVEGRARYARFVADLGHRNLVEGLLLQQLLKGVHNGESSFVQIEPKDLIHHSPLFEFPLFNVLAFISFL